MPWVSASARDDARTALAAKRATRSKPHGTAGTRLSLGATFGASTMTKRKTGITAVGNRCDSGMLERETGFEPATLSLGRRRTAPASTRTEPQPAENAGSGHRAVPHPAHRAATSSPKFGATLGATVQTVLRARFGEVELTVGAVAERLRVSTATVYSLCRRGELEHHRISRAIRVPESALAKYLGSATNTPKPTVAGAEQRE